MSEVLPKGLTGVYVDETKIATTDESGNLLYRGYRVVDLADSKDFESIAYLVIHGELPQRREKKRFNDLIKNNFMLADSSFKVIDALRARKPIDILRSGISSVEVTGNSIEDLITVASKFPEIVIYGTKGRHLSKDGGTFAERFYYSLTGVTDKRKAKLFEKILIMYMEHEFNASTFALRVTASTLADPVCAFCSAVSTLEGPIHGGANSAVMKNLLSFKNKEEAIAWVDAKLSKKELIMGFGHRVYKEKDPRAQFIKDLLLKNFGDVEAVKNAVEIENYIWEKKRLAANLDFYAALYMHLLGIEEKYFLSIFASSRVFGWIAHYIEQVQNNKLIRPLAFYTGLKNRPVE